jgi:hypothetical protein
MLLPPVSNESTATTFAINNAKCGETFLENPRRKTIVRRELPFACLLHQLTNSACDDRLSRRA